MNSFKDVVLGGPAKHGRGNAPLLRQDRVHGDHHGRRRVDGEIGRHLVDVHGAGIGLVNSCKIPERVDGHAHPADFPFGKRAVRVVSALGHQIKGHVGTAGPAHGMHPDQIIPVILGRAEPAVFAHAPGAAPVRPVTGPGGIIGIGPPEIKGAVAGGIRILTRKTDLFQKIKGSPRPAACKTSWGSWRD